MWTDAQLFILDVVSEMAKISEKYSIVSKLFFFSSSSELTNLAIYCPNENGKGKIKIFKGSTMQMYHTTFKVEIFIHENVPNFV